MRPLTFFLLHCGAPWRATTPDCLVDGVASTGLRPWGGVHGAASMGQRRRGGVDGAASTGRRPWGSVDGAASMGRRRRNSVDGAASMGRRRRGGGVDQAALTRQALTRQALTRQALTRQALTRQALTRQETAPRMWKQRNSVMRCCKTQNTLSQPAKNISAGRDGKGNPPALQLPLPPAHSYYLRSWCLRAGGFPLPPRPPLMFFAGCEREFCTLQHCITLFFCLHIRGAVRPGAC